MAILHQLLELLEMGMNTLMIMCSRMVGVNHAVAMGPGPGIGRQLHGRGRFCTIVVSRADPTL